MTRLCRFTALVLSLGLLAQARALAGQSSGVATRRRPAAATTVPQFIRFSGVLQGFDGKPEPAGVLGVTFLVFAEEEGGQSLWRETQNVSLDAEGRYTVALGASTPFGLPPEIFASGQARWLAIEPEGLRAPARVMLLSVPYALKAADAETLGGLPASAFLRAGSALPPTANASASSQSPAQPLSTTSLNGSGSANYIPRWTPDGSTLGNSILFQSGSGSAGKVGVNTSAPAASLDVNGATILRGSLQLLSRGTATAANGFGSQPLIMQASAFSTSTGKAAAPRFQWQAEAQANNTANPTASLNLLFSPNSTPIETGLKIAGNGQITFAPGQAFPGAGTLAGITAGLGLSGGGSSGNPTLSIDPSRVPMLGSPNTFTAPVTMTAPVTFAATQLFPGTVTSVAAGTGLSGGGSGGALTLSLNTGYSDGRYAQLGANNTFTGRQIVNNALGIGTAPAYPLHVNGTMRAETGLSLGGNAQLTIDAPGIIGGHLFVDGNGKVGIDNPTPRSELDVIGNVAASGSLTASSVNTSGSLAASSVKIGSDAAMSSAPRMYLTAYVQGPLALPGPVHALYTVPSKNIVVTRLIAGMVNVCWQTDTMVLYLFSNSRQIASLTVSGGAIPSDSGALSLPVAAGSQLSLEIKVPNCGFGATIAPGDIPISLEYIMQ